MCFILRKSTEWKIENQELTAAHQILHNSYVKVKKEKTIQVLVATYFGTVQFSWLLAHPPENSVSYAELANFSQSQSVLSFTYSDVSKMVKLRDSSQNLPDMYTHVPNKNWTKDLKGLDLLRDTCIVQWSWFRVPAWWWKLEGTKQFRWIKWRTWKRRPVIQHRLFLHCSFTVMQGRGRGISIDVTDMMCLLVFWTSKLCRKCHLKTCEQRPKPLWHSIILIDFLGILKLADYSNPLKPGSIYNYIIPSL